MDGVIRPFDLLQPTSADEAVGLLRDYGDEARLLSGGAMLSILLRERLIAPRCLISTTDIPGLGAIEEDDRGLSLGGTATLQAIEHSRVVRHHWRVLAEAAHLVGNVRVRNVATIGGHLAQADPHLDLPPVLVALDARAVAERQGGERSVPIAEFFTGYYENALGSDEMVTRVHVPVPAAGVSGAYLKYCSLSAADWPTVGVAAFMGAADGRASHVRVVVGCVADRPLRFPEVEALLEAEVPRQTTIDEVARRYADAAEPLDDLRGSAEYKRQVTRVYVRRAVAAAAARAGLAIAA